MASIKNHRKKFIPMKSFNEYYRKFARLHLTEDKIKLIMKMFQEHNVIKKLNNEINIPKKDSSMSNKMKKFANELYCKSNCLSSDEETEWDDIISVYSDSIRYAPPDSLELALSYANRSAMLFKVGLFSNCLKDIERALNLNYPDNQKAKLYARKVQCLVGLDSPPAEVTKAIDETKKWFKLMVTDNQKVKKMINDVISKPIAKSSLPEKDSVLKKYITSSPVPNDNPEIVGASSAVKIKYTKEHGRHLVATRDIDPGEVIAVQKSMVATVSFEADRTYCFNCSKLAWSGVACHLCVEVIYCSEECKQEAWSSHHHIECSIIDTISRFSADDGAIINVKILIKGLKEVGGNVESLQHYVESIDSNKDLRAKGFVNDVFNGQTFASFHSLPNYFEKRTTDDLIDLAIASTHLVYLLATKTEVFGQKLQDDWDKLRENKLVVFVASLLLKQFLRISMHSHFLLEQITCEKVCQSIYPFSSLMSHSCVSNVTEIASIDTTETLSTNYIKKGEMILFDHGYNFAEIPKRMRLKILRETCFIDCKCEACRKNWPLLDELPSVFDLEDLPMGLIIHLFFEFHTIMAKLAFYIDNPEIATHSAEDVAEIVRLIKLFQRFTPFPTREKSMLMKILSVIHHKRLAH